MVVNAAESENLRALTKLVLIFSAIGFFFLVVMFISGNSLLYIVPVMLEYTLLWF